MQPVRGERRPDGALDDVLERRRDFPVGGERGLPVHPALYDGTLDPPAGKAVFVARA
ncbi:hypothetical protein GCM10027258_39090 [Amycolatopsis stemonae]